MEKKEIGYQTLRNTLSIPFIWLMIVPLALCDICIEVYHRVCFPLYGIPYVKRSHCTYGSLTVKYLPDLTWFEKIWCAYCAYAKDETIASVIAGKTEAYWCAIAHIQGR